MKIHRRSERPKTKVLITYDALAKQQALVDQCDQEIGWFGLVDMIKLDNGTEVPMVYDILVPPQVVSGGSVEQGIEEGAEFSLADFLRENADVASKMKYYGHSHVNFGVTPSGTDLNQIQDWEDYGIPYMISYIENKKGESYCRLDQFKPRMLVSDVELVPVPDGRIENWAAEQISDHVTVKKIKRRRFKPSKITYDKSPNFGKYYVPELGTYLDEEEYQEYEKDLPEYEEDDYTFGYGYHL